MRKFIVSVPMILMLLLSACGAREARLEQGFGAFRQEMLAVDRLTARAELTTDSGGTASDYILEIQWDGQETTMEIVEPALIAGVKAAAKWGEGTIAYDGVMLGAGPIDSEGHTPVSAVPAILDAMAGGYTELLWWDGDRIAARLYVGESVRCTVWLEEDTLTPVTAELSEDGARILSCAFSDWTLTKES